MITPKYDAKYEQERNSLIPTAEAYANERVPRMSFDDDEEWKRAWDYVFHTKMNELWKQHSNGNGNSRK